MKHSSRMDVIGDALHDLYRNGVELESLGRLLREESEGSIEMRDTELEERAAKVRALATQSILSLTRALSVAERLQVMSETTHEGGAP